jgi:peptidoglycan/xylan/chitin deacetylase (PgdA/CDA1 family)
MSWSVPILMYHLVSSRRVRGFEKYTVSPETFAAQMTWLVRTGHTSVTLDDLVDSRCGCRALPPKPVVITFDDGYRDCIKFALPVLRELGLAATIFVVAGFVDGTSRWLIEDRGVEPLPLFSWLEAQQLRDAGIQCGSHALTHARLANVSAEQCRYELAESRRLLSERVGYEVAHLSFPHGSYSPAVQRTAREIGYRSACSVRIGLSAPGDDLFALHRVSVNGQDTLADFICNLYTGQTVAELTRAIARALLRAPRAKAR